MCGCSPPSLLNLLRANKDSKKKKEREAESSKRTHRPDQKGAGLEPNTYPWRQGIPTRPASQDERREEENEFVLKKGSGGSGSEEEQELPQIHKYETETEI